MRIATCLLFLPALFLSMVEAATARKPASLPGHIAYTRNGAAYLEAAAGEIARQVPGSKGAILVSLSPRGDTLVFFVTAGKSTGDTFGSPTRGMVSRAPFQRAEPLPAPWGCAFLPDLFWSPDGSLAYLWASNGPAKQREDLRAIYDPARGKLQTNPYPAETASSDGRVMAWYAEDEVLLYSAERKTPVKVFSASEPRPLEEALRHARHPVGIGPLLDLPKEQEGDPVWEVGPPALSPDGQRLFFPCNAGCPSGAGGNTTYAFFALDVRTRKLVALSRLGAIDGFRMPFDCRVSPDGKRLAYLYGAHASAISNPYYLSVVDLENQQSRELLHHERRHRESDNYALGTFSWSPDSRYVAQDTLYYDYQVTADGGSYIRPWKPGRGWGKRVSVEHWEPKDEDRVVLIFDATTGKVVREIPGAAKVTWGR